MKAEEIWVMGADGSGKRKLVGGPFGQPGGLDWIGPSSALAR